MDQLKRFERRYEREKKARLTAEELLETKSRELYESNRKLQEFSEELEKLVDRRTAELVEARDAALANARIKGEFLANMSHEIRTPMNGVLGMLHVLEGCDDAAKRRKLISIARQSGELLVSIINDVLEFSKIESVGVELDIIDISLTEVLENVLQNFATNAQSKHLNLVSDISWRLPSLQKGDSLRIKQVVGNFLNNAIKFTDHGEVVLKAEYLGDGQVRISVSDTGIGMTEQQCEEIFRAFSQADTSTTRKYGGTGLGLSIAAKIIDTMKSTIRVVSQQGMGTTFSFSASFPVVDSKCICDQYIPDVEEKCILVVSDCEPRRNVLISRFKELGIKKVNEFSRLDDVTLDSVTHSRDVIMFLDIIDESAETLRKYSEWKRHPNVKLIQIIPYSYDKDKSKDIDFRLYKPLLQSELVKVVLGETLSDAATYTPKEQAQFDFSGKKMLVVDDNFVNLQVAKEIFEAVGFELDFALNGQDAINLMKVKDNNVDLILIDVQMPDMDGLTATQHIRKLDSHCKTLPIFSMTAHALKEDYDKSIAAGMNEHITKPIEPRTLFPKLASYLKVKELAPQENAEGEPEININHDIPNLEGFALDEALKRLRGRWDRLRPLLISFIEKNCDANERLNHFLEDGDLDEAKKYAHLLKGTGANLGARLLSDVSARIETALKNGEQSIPPDLLVEFSQAVMITNHALDKLREGDADGGGNDDNRQPTVAINKGELAKILNSLALCLTEDLGQAQVEIDRLKVITQGTEWYEKYSKIESAFAQFNTEEIEKIITEFDVTE